MTPEDVKSQREDCELRMFWEKNATKRPKKPWVENWDKRILQWEFNEFHDGANYTVGEYRFWFNIVKDGAVKVGYEHRSPVAGTNQSIPWSYPLGEFKNIKSLEEIDALFRFTSPHYK